MFRLFEAGGLPGPFVIRSGYASQMPKLRGDFKGPGLKAVAILDENGAIHPRVFVHPESEK